MNQLIVALILSFLPISELRGGMPVALDYAIKQNFPVALAFLSVIIANISAMFFLFFFLDFIHKKLLGLNAYNRMFNAYISRVRKKSRRLEKNMKTYSFLALTLFVAVPLPTTGAWTGTIIAWLLGLDRKKSIIAISLGVIIAGLLVLLASLGIFRLFNVF